LIEALYDYLFTEDTITNLVSTRIYPCVLPENPTYPALAYTLISDVGDHTLDGTAETATSRVQIDVFSSDHNEVNIIATTLRLALDGASGTMGDYFVIAKLDSQQENTNPYEDGSGQWIYQRSMDFMFRYVQRTHYTYYASGGILAG
jgi:hypothetical protein